MEGREPRAEAEAAYHFSIVPVATGDDVPGSVAESLRGGVPRRMVLGDYRALSRAVRIEGTHSGLIAFGVCEGEAPVCVDAASGEIVYLDRFDDEHDPMFVNSSLRHFSACAKAVTERFPFYSERDCEADPDVPQRVTDELNALVEGIDPPLADCQSYWFENFSDVSIGDYCTEDVEREFGPLT